MRLYAVTVTHWYPGTNGVAEMSGHKASMAGCIRDIREYCKHLGLSAENLHYATEMAGIINDGEVNGIKGTVSGDGQVGTWKIEKVVTEGK